MTHRSISRRALCASSFLVTACSSLRSRYFGQTTPPARQTLSYVIGGEPDSLDPAYQMGGYEGYIIPTLFEGLTAYHPRTLEPMAALATHYEEKLDPTQLIFYLRGHPNPQGRALPNTNDLRAEFQKGKLPQDYSRGRHAPPDSVPARWSDGHTVTAHDFVFAWRRLVDPHTAAPYAYTLSRLRNAEAIQAGKLPPESLGVHAVDDFTLRIDLRGPASLFLKALAIAALAAVPRWAIETARQQGAESSWMEPGRIVSNGPFLLKRRTPYDRTVVVRNPNYYEAGLVALEEIEFFPVADGVTTANLYRAGRIHSMPGERLSPLIQPFLAGYRDFQVTPACFVIWHGFNNRKPPFDNLRLRYALNMATDKAAIARTLGAGRIPARSMLPPDGYDGPQSLPVRVDGISYDVLAYDPQAARSMLAKAGYPEGRSPDGRQFKFEMRFPTLPHSKPIAEMLHQQWRVNLNVEPNLVVQEFTAFFQAVLDLSYPGDAEGGGWPDYLDPEGLFDWFANGSPNSGTGYADAAFDSLVAKADAVADPAARMRALAACERRLMESMPLIPLFHNVWAYLQKPFVRGLGGNALDKHPFKYAWIDTHWRES